MLHAAVIALVATTAAPPTREDLLRARSELLRGVHGLVMNAAGDVEVVYPEGRIPQYAWDDPTKLHRTFTRRELVEHLVHLNNDALANGAPGITLKSERVLESIPTPQRITLKDWNAWTGQNVAVDRSGEHPDDAIWYPIQRHAFRRSIHLPKRGTSSDEFAVQMVEWYGADPRIGFNAQDGDGVWGFDPKRAADDERVAALREKERAIRAGLEPSVPAHYTYTDDGQGGYLGVNVGFAFTPDDSAWHGILWISFKEAYLEFVHRETGQRIAQGMNGQRYVWNIRR